MLQLQLTVYIHYIYSYMSFTSKCYKKTCCEGWELNLQIICLGWFGFCFISGAFCVRVATLLIMLSRKAALSAFSWPQISLSISIMWENFSSCIYNVTPLGLIRCTTFVWCCSTSLLKAATSSSAELCHFLLGMLENKQVWNVNEQQKICITVYEACKYHLLKAI